VSGLLWLPVRVESWEEPMSLARAIAEDESNVDDLVHRMEATRLLSAAEEVELAKRIERGDLDAKRRMIESNVRLVFAVARSHLGRGVPLADLAQEGTIGLVRAVEGFDYRRGCRLSTYAVWWIRRSVRDAVANADLIRIPVKAGQQLAAVRRVEAELERGGRRSASDEAIAARAGLPVHVVQSLRGAARVTASLDEPAGHDGASLGELLPDEHALDPVVNALEFEDLGSVASMVSLLPDRHRHVVERHYGLGNRVPQTHQQIGAWLGVGEQRSRQIEREALQRLRAIATSSAARAA
jgi:RNA polymerase primary sigma factor